MDITVKKKIVEETRKLLLLYQYERRPYFYDRSDPNKKIYLKIPHVYLDYETMNDDTKKKMYSKFLKNDEFKRYIDALHLRDVDNSSNEAHLNECISFCDDLGPEYEDHVKDFTKILMTFANRERYYWEVK